MTPRLGSTVLSGPLHEAAKMVTAAMIINKIECFIRLLRLFEEFTCEMIEAPAPGQPFVGCAGRLVVVVLDAGVQEDLVHVADVCSIVIKYSCLLSFKSTFFNS